MFDFLSTFKEFPMFYFHFYRFQTLDDTDLDELFRFLISDASCLTAFPAAGTLGIQGTKNQCSDSTVMNHKVYMRII